MFSPSGCIARAVLDHRRGTETFIAFPVGEQCSGAGRSRTVKFETNTGVEIDTQGFLFAITHWIVSFNATPRPASTYGTRVIGSFNW